jgi:hypothetical protein
MRRCAIDPDDLAQPRCQYDLNQRAPRELRLIESLGDMPVAFSICEHYEPAARSHMAAAGKRETIAAPRELTSLRC